VTPIGIVATGDPAVSAAGAEVLRGGGNAFDAAVAAGFASAVAEPALTSLGGGGFLLARTADGQTVLFDFFVDTPGCGRDTSSLDPHFLPVTVRFPGSEQVFNVGYGSVAVPGTLKGLLHVHERLGRLPLDRIVTPAARLAREGAILGARQAYFLDLLLPIFTLTPRSRETFFTLDDPPREGRRLQNPDLARFLESLPEDRGASLYTGRLAEAIDREMLDGEGLLTAEDLAAYRVIERSPLEQSYRNVRVLTNPPPSFGGSLLALSLELLGAEPMSGGFGSASQVCRVAAAQAEVEALRQSGITSPESLRAEDRDCALRRLRTASGGTTHIAVADAEGNVASMTNSDGEGSGYVVPGTGIMLNNMLGEDDLHPEGFHASPPGERVASMMSPSIVVDDGDPVLVIGSGGSKRIRSAILQVLTHVIDFDAPLQEAVDAPRIHWDGELLQVEPGHAEPTLEALRTHWPVNVWTERDVYFGGVQAVEPGRAGAGDPRRGGAVERVTTV
jgi:gamma-glutamyltranspeptidase/glutathione hydrolase